MINIIFYNRKLGGSPKRITVSGHAGYATDGQDIVCAAVSALTINLANSIENLTDTVCDISSDDGLIDIVFGADVDEKCDLLIASYRLGIESIIKAYTSSFIKIETKEV